MYIQNATIKNFRAFTFENLGETGQATIELGKNITCIAGHNGIGKTTILAALSNCGELKTAKGKHLNGRQFRSEYSDLIKADPDHDSSGEKIRLTFGRHSDTEELEAETLAFRATFQKRTTRASTYEKSTNHENLYLEQIEEHQIVRYRLIPIKTTNRPHERKLNWPTYYLGLSRLYPIGESETVDDRKLSYNSELYSELYDRYNSILSIDHAIERSSIVRPSDAPHKYGTGITTSEYGPLANSAGQDNLGQILLTLLSFKNLKNKLGDEYNGGLLLIDEIEATLHPAAQAKLFDYLLAESKALKLQIVFTTHSLSLIEHITDLDKLHPKNDSLKLLYFTNPRGQIEITENPEFDYVRNDLKNLYVQSPHRATIPIIMEDEVARDLLKWILDHHEKKLNLRYNDANLGWTQICALITSYWEFFYDSLIVLDPDLNADPKAPELRSKLEGTRFCVDNDTEGSYRRQVLTLPGSTPLESQFWNLISNLDNNDKFYYYDEVSFLQVYKRTLIDPYLDELRTEYHEKPLNFHKRWFDQYLPPELRASVYLRWHEENGDLVSDFLNQLEKEYLRIIRRGTYSRTAGARL